MFNFYTMMRKFAATAALGALAIAGMLQPAHAQSAAAPAKTYKPGEYELYDAALKALGSQNFAKAISDAEAWKSKAPDSDYKHEREALLVQAFFGAKQYDKALSTAEPLLNQDIDKAFPDPATGPGQVIPVLRVAAASIQQIKEPTQQQLQTAEKAARLLASYNRKPQGMDDASWSKNQQAFAAEGNGALMYITVVPGANALAKNDCENAQNLLGRAAGAYPDNAYIAYQLGLAYRCSIKATPAKAEELQPKAIYQFVRALVIDPSLGGTQDAKKMTEILTNIYVNYHGSDEGLAELKASAKGAPMPPANFTIESGQKIAERKQKEFETKFPKLAMWLGIKSQLSGPEGPAYFESSLKNAAVPTLKGNVVEGKPACRSKELLVSVPEPEQEHPTTVITLKLDAPLTGKPVAGEIEWEGVPSAFTQDPFMLTMDTEKAKITGLKVEPCSVAPAARPGAKKGATPKKK